LLTDAGAHQERLKRDAEDRFFVCSGYLYAFRRNIVQHIPEDALAEDAVVSHMVGQAGYRVRYAPQAEVYVTYPRTYRDWLLQKVRSAGGYAQPLIANSPLRMRSFWHEARGSLRALRYGRTPREVLWTFLLFAARLHLWALIFWRVRVRKLPLTALWQRVETTKAAEDQL
jgi:cellulose synthase/poly-beta-1,6-N-acetylglucosamine synthase-like glycosyltransferase